MKPIKFPKWYLKYAHYILGIIGVIGIAVSQCGCAGTVPPGAYVFKTEASKAVEDAADRFDRLDFQEQEKILTESQQGSTVANLKSYDDKIRKPIITGFVTFQGALGAYSAALSAAAARFKADWIGLGLRLVAAGIELVETLKRLKVNVPFTMPAFLAGVK